MPRARIRAAIVGAGLMGRWHGHACERAGGEVIAVVDPDREAARRLAARHDAAAADSLDDLAPDLPVEVIHICTPTESHEQEVLRGLRRRCPLIVEKPVAPTEAATRGLLVSAREAGTWIAPVHQLMFQAGIRRAQRWMATCGVLRLFDYRLCSAGASGSAGLVDQIAADVLPHPLSLVEALAPGGLEAIRRWRVDRPASGELSATALHGEGLVRLLVSMHGRPPQHELTLVTDGGTLTVDLFHGFAWVEGPGVSRLRKAVRPFVCSGAVAAGAALGLARRALARDLAYPGLTALVGEAYAALDRGHAAPIDERHVLAVARGRDRILQESIAS